MPLLKSRIISFFQFHKFACASFHVSLRVQYLQFRINPITCSVRTMKCLLFNKVICIISSLKSTNERNLPFEKLPQETLPYI